MLSVQESAQREASRLATALTSPTVRGSWGEITLKRCVEMAGMSEFCDFSSQESFSLDEGRRIRPDLIIRGYVEVDGKPHKGFDRVVNFKRETIPTSVDATTKTVSR